MKRVVDRAIIVSEPAAHRRVDFPRERGGFDHRLKYDRDVPGSDDTRARVSCLVVSDRKPSWHQRGSFLVGEYLLEF